MVKLDKHSKKFAKKLTGKAIAKRVEQITCKFPPPEEVYIEEKHLINMLNFGRKDGYVQIYLKHNERIHCQIYVHAGQALEAFKKKIRKIFKHEKDIGNFSFSERSLAKIEELIL